MQTTDLMIVMIALRLASLYLREFILSAQDNDEREIPHHQLFEVILSPYVPKDTKKAWTKFHQECERTITHNQAYIELLRQYLESVTEKPLQTAIDLAIQFYKNQINGMNFSMDTHRPYYEVMLEYHPNLSSDLEKSIIVLHHEAQRLFQIVSQERKNLT